MSVIIYKEITGKNCSFVLLVSEIRAAAAAAEAAAEDLKQAVVS